MRKVLLLASLCMALALVLSAPAMAQDDLNCDDLSEAEEQAVFNANPSDPNNLDDDDDSLPCEDDETDNGSFTLPTEETTVMEPTSVEPTTVEPTTASPTASPTATAAPSASVLPETGGSAAAISIVSLALIVGTGIMAFGIMRRN